MDKFENGISKLEFEKLEVLENLLTKAFGVEKEAKKTFHQMIQNEKDYLLNYFGSKNYYSELMPYLEKSSKGELAYKKLIKKGAVNKKTRFFRILIREIEKKTKTKKEDNQNKDPKLYLLPPLDIMKLRKKEFDKRYLAKQLACSNSEKHISNYDSKLAKSCSLKHILFERNKNERNNNNQLNLLNSNETNFSNGQDLNEDEPPKKKTDLLLSERRYKKFNTLIKICQNEIAKGEGEGKCINRRNERINKIMDNIKNEKTKRENEEKNIDKNVIEDESDKKDNKYEQQVIFNFNEIKRKLDTVISEKFAYSNRKEYSEYAKKENENLGYELYLKDMKKINEEILNNQAKKKKQLNDIDVLLDDVYKGKEYLKKQIQRYHDQYIANKEKEKEKCKYRTSQNDEFYILKNQPDEIKAYKNKNKDSLSFKQITQEILKKIEVKDKPMIFK